MDRQARTRDTVLVKTLRVERWQVGATAVVAGGGGGVKTTENKYILTPLRLPIPLETEVVDPNHTTAKFNYLCTCDLYSPVHNVCEISQVPQNSRFPAPTPPHPLPHVIYLPRSKTLRTGPYKS